MAAHGNTNGDAPYEQEMNAHRASYDRFIGWLKWGAIVAFVVAAIAVVLVAS